MMRAAFLCLLPLALQAAELQRPLQQYDVARVAPAYDGDTVDVEIRDGYNRFVPLRLRLFGIDAPEYWRLDSRAEAIISRDYLRRRLAACPHITITVGSAKDGTVQQDNFGRVLARLFCEDAELGQELIREGLAVPYPPPTTQGER